MRGPILELSDAALAQYLWGRRGTMCTMCGGVMSDGYCPDVQCETYSPSQGAAILSLFKTAIQNTHNKFKKRTSLKPSHAKTVSGGRVDSKRRKH